MKRLVFLIILLAFIWAGVFLWPEKKDEQKANWPDFKKFDIVKIQFDQFELVKDKDKWRVKEKGQNIRPYADQTKVDALIDFLQVNSPKRFLGSLDKDKVGEFGLDKPKQLVIYAQEKWSVQVGDKNPSEDGVYALSSSYPGELLLMNAAYADKVGAGSDTYYELKLLPFDDEQITRVRLLENNSTRWDVLKKDGEFTFNAPEEITRYKVSSSEATSLFFELGSMRAQSLDFKKDQAKLQFTLEVFHRGGETPLKIKIFKAKEKYLAQVDQNKWYFVLDQAQHDNLNKTSFLLKDRSIIHLDTGQAHKMDLVISGKNVQLYKVNGVWKHKDSDQEVPGMGLYLWRLSDLKYEQDPKSQLPSTASRIVIWAVKDKQDKDLVKVYFYEDSALPADRCWVQVAGQSSYYVVDSSLLEDLKTKVE
ncbi:DUF4340 domain-containing protein [Desulfohalobiaceae bacterium Ax17]|uniref:DUF4340 domain-containing protein n=1 Tax=Desulfovulcanus ferrireducens TaxID=2831190 RepID=UPI00207BB995|nr:DUF4340 domain-containing protein [Desulfovulcanus ferrireducens]MBT8763829.1 DUF4340 domain-containing protein [Desulfovulcanus ferrireducens]